MAHVTVVLPTYNRANTLARAIDSVLAQTFTNFEIVVVDDGSTDTTRSVLSRYAGAANVRILTTAHRGCSAARNSGILASSSQYIAFQDSDDEWLPTLLDVGVAALENAGPEAGVSYSDMTRVHGDGTTTPFRAPHVRRGRFIDEDTLDFQVGGIGIQSTLIRRTCFARVGLFDESLPRLIDLDLFIRLADAFDFIRCGEELVRYHQSAGISFDTMALVVARRQLMMKYYARLRQNPAHLANQRLLLAAAFSDNGNNHLSSLFALRAVLTSPGHPRVRREGLRMLSRKGRGAFSRLRARAAARLSRGLPTAPPERRSRA